MNRIWWRSPLVWGAVLAGQLALIGVVGAGLGPLAHGAAADAGDQSMAGMAMTMSPAAGAGHLVVRLHQRVVRVTITGYAFSPANLAVSPGTRIIWTNRDGDPHTVDSTKGVWSSEALDTDSQFARVFRTTGTFPYYCSIHPFMHATIIVKK